VGIIIALFFANKQEVINLEGLIDFNLDSFLDVIPVGIVKDAKDITVRSISTSTRCLRLIIGAES
jgi:hypothetical protein